MTIYIYCHTVNIWLLDMKIINSGSTGREIAHSVLGFSGGERHLQLEGLGIAELSEVTIRARVHSSDDLVDLLLAENALRYKYGAGLKLNLELPYLPYARQDRVCAPGQAFSLEVLSSLLKIMRINKLAIWDCHSSVGTALTKGINVSPVEIIQHDHELLTLMQDKNSVLVCPDKGAVGRCTDIKKQLGLTDVVFCEKKRDPATGKIYKTEVLADDLTGKCAVISDDICDGGFTFIKIAEQLREKNVDKVILFVTHGIFSKGLEVFDGLIDEIVTTNSFDHEEHKKLQVIDFEYNFKR